MSISYTESGKHVNGRGHSSPSWPFQISSYAFQPHQHPWRFTDNGHWHPQGCADLFHFWVPWWPDLFLNLKKHVWLVRMVLSLLLENKSFVKSKKCHQHQLLSNNSSIFWCIIRDYSQAVIAAPVTRLTSTPSRYCWTTGWFVHMLEIFVQLCLIPEGSLGWIWMPEALVWKVSFDGNTL